MNLTIATAFIAASTTSATSVSTSGVAASILEHENNKGSFRTASAKKQGVECTLANTADVHSPDADLGVLSSCNVGEVCVKDSTSKIGGRCELVVSANNEAAAAEPRRELCLKCYGSFACNGVDRDNIGCGSCIGFYVCQKLSPDVTIGTGSCAGAYACEFAGGELNIVSVR
eukprot:scaffold34602_cov40-Cyclotella_meneghiniana.AAC.4